MACLIHHGTLETFEKKSIKTYYVDLSKYYADFSESKRNIF